MGAPTGCVRSSRASFSIVRFWAKCLRCGHLFIACEMVACVGGRGDKCDKCGSKNYKFVRYLTLQEKMHQERMLRDLLGSLLMKKI